MTSKSDAPAPPDPKVTADAQNSTSIGTTIANTWMQPDLVTPDGSRVTQQNGNVNWADPFTGKTYQIPRFIQTTTLSPQQLKIKEQQDAAKLKLGTLANDQVGRVNSLLSQPFTLNGLPQGGDAGGIRTGNYKGYANGPGLKTDYTSAAFKGGPQLKTSYVDDFSEDRQRVEDALMSRLQTTIDKDRTALDTRLANQGIRLGSTAYDRAMDESNRQVTDARLGAILGAGQEQSRLAGLERDQATFGNNAQQQMFSNQFDVTGANNALNRDKAGFYNTTKQQMADNLFRSTTANNDLVDKRTNQDLLRFNAQNTDRKNALDERFATRNQPLNEIAALLSGSQVTNPQFSNTNMPTLPTTDVAGLINSNYGQQLANYQNQQQQNNSLMGGLFGLGGSVAGALPWASILSDDDAKKDKTPIAELVPGMHAWSYRYKGENGPKRVGLMASEVEKKVPAAVKRGADGYRRVNYPMAMGAILRAA